jgi:hypothetical protein
MARPLRITFAGELFGNAWFARHVVVNRWFLHAHQPALAAEALQCPSSTGRLRGAPSAGRK